MFKLTPETWQQLWNWMNRDEPFIRHLKQRNLGNVPIADLQITDGINYVRIGDVNMADQHRKTHYYVCTRCGFPNAFTSKVEGGTIMCYSCRKPFECIGTEANEIPAGEAQQKMREGVIESLNGSPIFYRLLEQMARTHDKKSHDYASNSNPFGNYHFAGRLSQLFDNSDDAGFVGRIGEKLFRLANLENDGKNPANESIEDTEIDLCTIMVLWMADRRTRRMTNTAKSAIPIGGNPGGGKTESLIGGTSNGPTGGGNTYPGGAEQLRKDIAIQGQLSYPKF